MCIFFQLPGPEHCHVHSGPECAQPESRDLAPGERNCKTSEYSGTKRAQQPESVYWGNGAFDIPTLTAESAGETQVPWFTCHCHQINTRVSSLLRYRVLSTFTCFSMSIEPTEMRYYAVQAPGCATKEERLYCVSRMLFRHELWPEVGS